MSVKCKIGKTCYSIVQMPSSIITDVGDMYRDMYLSFRVIVGANLFRNLFATQKVTICRYSGYKYIGVRHYEHLTLKECIVSAYPGDRAEADLLLRLGTVRDEDCEEPTSDEDDFSITWDKWLKVLENARQAAIS